MKEMEKKGRSPFPPVWMNLIGGGAGGAFAVFCTCPLEVIKTRQQALRNHRSRMPQKRFGMRTFFVLKEIFYKEGVAGLWRGLLPNLMGVAPARAINFTTYSLVKGFARNTLEMKESSFVNLTAAVISGGTVVTLTSPIWLIKTRMQLQIPGHEYYTSTTDCIAKVFREEGFRGFFKGMGASYLGITETALQFVLYEKFKRKIQENKVLEEKCSGVPLQTIPLSNIEYLAIASLAKLIASMTTYPHEVIRTRLREQRTGKELYKGVFHAFRTIAKEEGAKGLYGGMAVHLMRVVPNAAIMFYTYETIVRFLQTQFS